MTGAVAQFFCVEERERRILLALHEFPFYLVLFLGFGFVFRERHLHSPTGMQSGRLFVFLRLLFLLLVSIATLRLLQLLLWTDD